MSKNYALKNTDTLLITDIQIDFLPGGALPVDNGDTLIPVLNDYIKLFQDANAHILASRDWHPADHISFKARGGPWPPHCVQQTPGAKFSPDLKLPKKITVISKATNPDKEAYSAFEDTSLAHELKMQGAKRLFVGGLTTDYCIVNTVLDAQRLGFETIVLMDATLGINVNPGDVDRAIDAMVKSGAQQATADDFPDAIDTLPIPETTPDALAEKPLQTAEVKKKARMRSKGSAKRIKTERRG